MYIYAGRQCEKRNISLFDFYNNNKIIVSEILASEEDIRILLTTPSLFHGKREAGSFSFFTSMVNCFFFSHRVDYLWILHAYQHHPKTRSIYMLMTHLLSCPHFPLSILASLSTPSTYPSIPWGCYWQIAMDTSQISNIVCAMEQWQLTCRLVMKNRLKEIMHVQCSSRTVPGVEQICSKWLCYHRCYYLHINVHPP